MKYQERGPLAGLKGKMSLASVAAVSMWKFVMPISIYIADISSLALK